MSCNDCIAYEFYGGDMPFTTRYRLKHCTRHSEENIVRLEQQIANFEQAIYNDSKQRPVQCIDTGSSPVSGCCPIHKGDNCLDTLSRKVRDTIDDLYNVLVTLTVKAEDLCPYSKDDRLGRWEDLRRAIQESKRLLRHRTSSD